MKKVFSLLLTAALALPVLCAPVFATAQPATSTCPHVFNPSRTETVREPQWNSTQHWDLETEYLVCLLCGAHDTVPRAVRKVGVANHSYTSASPSFVYSTHAGNYVRHTWTYHQYCRFCSYIKVTTIHAGCNANGCALDPMSVTPSIK